MTAVAGAQTRERLLRAARAVIEDGGYSAASVAAIAQRAGVAAGTLYRHFDSKEELFVDVFRAVCRGEERAMRSAAAARAEEANDVDRLEAVLVTFAERALRNRRLAWALIAEPVDPLVDAERLAYRKRYAAVVADVLRDAIDAKEIPPQDVDFTSAALVGACGEALAGPLSPLADAAQASDEVVAALRTFVRRAVGGSR